MFSNKSIIKTVRQEDYKFKIKEIYQWQNESLFASTNAENILKICCRNLIENAGIIYFILI